MSTSRKLLVGAVVVLVAVVVAGVVLTLRDTSRPVTVDEARERLDGSSGDEPGGAAALRPEPGVYRYEGEGSEALSLPPLSQGQGPTMPGTVEWIDDRCWSFRIDFSTNHWQQWTYCDADGDLVETGGQSWQRWMIGTSAVTNLSDFVCEPHAMTLPADPDPDTTYTGRCVGTNEQADGETVSEGPYRFVGDEDVDVDGMLVRTRRFERVRDMSGAQRGTERSQVWFARDTGLPVRNERTIEVVAETPIGSSTYTESGEFTLVAVGPE